MYQSMVFAIALTAESVEYNSSLMTHVAVADAAHSRAWILASMKIAGLF